MGQSHPGINSAHRHRIKLTSLKNFALMPCFKMTRGHRIRVTEQFFLQFVTQTKVQFKAQSFQRNKIFGGKI